MNRRSSGRLALLVGSTTLCALVAEVTARLTAPDAYHVWPPGLKRTIEVEVDGALESRRFTINALGMRGDPFDSSAGLRALAFGGSTTICSLLDDADVWPHVAQQRINDASGDHAAWIGNVGRPGHATRENLAQAEILLEQHPDVEVALLLAGGNDAIYALSGQPVHPLPNPREELRRAFLLAPLDPAVPWYAHSGLHAWIERNRLASRLGATRRFTMQDGLAVRQRRFRKAASRLRSDVPDLLPALQGYRERLDRTAELAASRGVRLLLITQPALWRDDLTPDELDLLWMGGPPWQLVRSGATYFTAGALATALEQFNDEMRAICRAGRAECIDAARAIPRTKEMFSDDVHFTRAGSRRLGALVADYLLATPHPERGRR